MEWQNVKVKGQVERWDEDGENQEVGKGKAVIEYERSEGLEIFRPTLFLLQVYHWLSA